MQSGKQDWFTEQFKQVAVVQGVERGPPVSVVAWRNVSTTLRQVVFEF